MVGEIGRTVSLLVRRALVVGVTRFDHHEELEFAPGLVNDLGSKLEKLGYDVHTIAHSVLSSAQLGSAVTRVLNSGNRGDLSIVHVITHGQNADGDATVFALGSDGAVDGNASIAHWLTMQQNTDRPLTLFLLDLCSAGTSARLPWQVQLNGPVRGWVIAASRPGETAYDGRFTQAVITVLQQLRDGELDIDPSFQFVPLTTVARAIRREVNRRVVAADSYAQQVTASLVDISADDEPPFFPNPAYSRSRRPQLRAATDPGLLPFLDDLDEGLDARHFVERATGLGRLTDLTDGLVGCFTGRDRELRQVSPWLNGEGDRPLCVVTGSPGSGKSALLGVLVCAASPLLRTATEPVWNRIAQAPLSIRYLAAVHARQRGLAAVTASIARQLGLPESLPAEELVRALRKRHGQPVIVVDALDEADDPLQIMTSLLLPLTARSSSADSSVRLLVGVRRYADFAPLFDQAWMFDLDSVEREVLEDDLSDYINSLLRTTVIYRDEGGARGAFAHQVARILAAPDPNGSRRWGPFLVAGLYTRYFINAYAERPVTNPAQAGELGKAVPADLRQVLELDLGLQRDQRWLRPVMLALAHARGLGMPVSVLTRVASVFVPGAPLPSVAEIRSALAAGKVYLRQSMDSDRSNIYRLFHQGLADTLTQRPFLDAGTFLDALVLPLGPEDNRDWNAAEPYLVRHVADHAREAGRLREIETDPGLLLHLGSSPDLTAAGEDAQAVLSLPASIQQFAGVTSPANLALAATRVGKTELARRAANLPSGPPLTWQPRWVVGEPGLAITWSESIVTHTADLPIHTVAMTADGSQVIAIGAETAGAWSWSPSDGQVVEEEPLATAATAIAISSRGVLVGRSDGRIALYDANGGIRTSPHRHASEVLAVAMHLKAPTSCVSVDGDGTLIQWMPQLMHKKPKQRAKQKSPISHLGHRSSLWCVTAGPNGAVACSVDEDGDLLVFESSQRNVPRTYPTSFMTVSALAIAPDSGHIVAADDKGQICVVDRRKKSTRYLRSGHIGPVSAVAVSGNGEYVISGGQDGTVRVWRIAEDNPIRVVRFSAPIRTAAVDDNGHRIAAVDENGAVFLNDLRAGSMASLRPQASMSSRNGDTRRPVWSNPGERLVTAFAILDTRAIIGWSDGTISDVDASTGIASLDIWAALDEAVLNIATPVIHGNQTVLVAIPGGYRLFQVNARTSAEPIAIDREEYASDLMLMSAQSITDHIVLDGRLTAVSGEDDSISIVNVSQHTLLGPPLGHHPGCSIVRCAHADQRPIAFTGGTDGVVRVWDLIDRRLADLIDIGRPIWRIETLPNGHLFVGAGGELLAFQHVNTISRENR
ncbi:AAA family ATPase [Kibdelosporangium lantanae]|uniref:AAA family ATPase n=1 Tax=Kibdelosporangium lantanae TaxID=1497396 RepID=A0ABW3M303_9PSEU